MSKTIPLEIRFWAKVRKTETCWLWTAAVDSKGYGLIANRFSTSKRAHRVAYEMIIGPIPLGMQIDHKCYVHPCVNPEHLQLATNQQNQENAAGPYRNGTSGYRGVCYSKRSGKWVAHARSGGRRYTAGSWATPEEASVAAIALRNRLMTNNLLDRYVAGSPLGIENETTR